MLFVVRLTLNYALKLKAHPENPAYDSVFKSDLSDIYDAHPNEIRPLSLRVRPLLQAAGVDSGQISESLYHASPPWTLPVPEIWLDLTKYKKIRDCWPGISTMFKQNFQSLSWF